MQFQPNADGSITVSWDMPAIDFTWDPTTNPALPQSTTLPTLTPVPNGAVAQGTPPTALQLLTAQSEPYGCYGVLHVQFGADPSNTIRDLFVPLTHTTAKTETGSAVLATGIQIPPTSISLTLSAATLNDALAPEGLYAIGYLFVNWVDTQDQQGKWIAAYEYATNATAFQPQPPSAPANLGGSLDSDGSVDLQWQQSLSGTGTILAYRVSWGGTPGGPYPNVATFPITDYPLETSSIFRATVGAPNFASDGKTRYFVVQALDDGSSLPEIDTVPPNTIVYFPSNLPDATALQSPRPLGGPGIIHPPLIEGITLDGS